MKINNIFGIRKTWGKLMIRPTVVTLLSSICFSAHAGLVNFTEVTDLPNSPAGAPTFVLDSSGVNQWSGTSFFNQPGGGDFDWFVVNIAAGTTITDIDLTSSNPVVSGWNSDLLQQVTFRAGASQEYHESDGVIISFENVDLDNLPFGTGSLRVAVGPQQGGCPSGTCTASWNWTLSITTTRAGPDIDIKPGSDPNSVNLCSGGSVPVAILGSESFNVFDVVTGTLRFAEAAVKVVGKKNNELCSYEDVNSDGYSDLVCKYVTTDIAAVDGESSSADVNGELIDGTPFKGTDSINIVKDTCY